MDTIIKEMRETLDRIERKVSEPTTAQEIIQYLNESISGALDAVTDLQGELDTQEVNDILEALQDLQTKAVALALSQYPNLFKVCQVRIF